MSSSENSSNQISSEDHEKNFSSRSPTETHCERFPNQKPPQAHPEDFTSKVMPQVERIEDFSNRVPPAAHQEEHSNRSHPETHRVEFLNQFSSEVRPANFSARITDSQREHFINRICKQREEFSERDEFTSELSSDIDEDEYSNPLPADLSSPRDIRGVAHGVFGTGNGKTLPEMIQSGRNAGLPLYVRCPICQKEFKQKSTLLQHGCIHIESRPYPCGECGKRFRQQSHLTQHLRIHTNEKPYGCLYCGRNFRQRTILNQHVRIHTGEKPYKCAQCGKDFRQKAILDQHTRTHQGDRPYCCPLPNCRRRFAAEAEVKRHVENHVGPKRKPPPPGVSMNPTPLVKPELYLPQCYTHPGNFQQQYAMSQLLGSTPPQPTALVQ